MKGRIDWVQGRPFHAIQKYLRWRGAVEKADQGDSSDLTALLRSNSVLGPEARFLIADLLDRRSLGRKRGAQPTPSYLTTPVEGRLHNLHALVRYFQKDQRLSLADAMQAALREEKHIALRQRDAREYTEAELDEMISEKDQQALANFVAGKRGSTRRMRKRYKGQ